MSSRVSKVFTFVACALGAAYVWADVIQPPEECITGEQRCPALICEQGWVGKFCPKPPVGPAKPYNHVRQIGVWTGTCQESSDPDAKCPKKKVQCTRKKYLEADCFFTFNCCQPDKLVCETISTVDSCD